MHPPEGLVRHSVYRVRQRVPSNCQGKHRRFREAVLIEADEVDEKEGLNCPSYVNQYPQTSKGSRLIY
jgi:hypothetical protein